MRKGPEAGVWKAEAGLTLIEVSVILSVLVILATFLLPALFQFLNDASSLQAERDVQAIATGLVNFIKDTGQSPTSAARLTEWAGAEQVELLAGPGQRPEINRGQIESLPRGRLTAGRARIATASESGSEGWLSGQTGALEDYLQVNGLGLPHRAAGVVYGWNGPYISTELDSDPWGNQYLVNVVFFGTAAAAGDGQGGERRAVYVLSAGPNQILETPFSQPVSDAHIYGDDIAARIR